MLETTATEAVAELPPQQAQQKLLPPSTKTHQKEEQLVSAEVEKEAASLGAKKMPSGCSDLELELHQQQQMLLQHEQWVLL